MGAGTDAVKECFPCVEARPTRALQKETAIGLRAQEAGRTGRSRATRFNDLTCVGSEAAFLARWSSKGEDEGAPDSRAGAGGSPE